MAKRTMYLVVVRTNLDELPILLTGSHKRAYNKAANVTEGEIKNSADEIGIDYAGLIASAVIEFKGGVPQGIDNVRDFGEEPLKSAEDRADDPSGNTAEGHKP